MCFGVFCEFWDLTKVYRLNFPDLKLPVGSDIIGVKSGGALDDEYRG